MNILDAVIIVVLLIGALAGYRRGLIKQAVLLVGFKLLSDNIEKLAKRFKDGFTVNESINRKE